MLVEEQQERAGKAVRLVQVTDPHLFARPEGKLAGLNCQQSFEAVLGLVRRQQQGLDCLVCTGDISQDASVTGYRRFHAALEPFGVPRLYLPGNHDLLENLRAAIGIDSPCLRKILDIGAWRLIMLDSSVRQQVHGHLAPEELDFLDGALARAGEQGRHALVCVHHNPLPVNARWLQKHALRNAADFLAVLDRHRAVRGVLWGHIHQQFDADRKGVRMMASPSTCIQFHPDKDEFSLDRRNPGYRWLDLRGDGAIETGVERVEGISFDIDFSSAGY